MNLKHRCTALIVLLGIILPAGCAHIREQVKSVKNVELAKAAQTIAASEPKALWQTVMHAQEADYIGFIGPDRILVSEQELIGADLILELEAAKPGCGAICLYNAKTGNKIWTYPRKSQKQHSLIASSPSIVLMGMDGNMGKAIRRTYGCRPVPEW
jgi:hypothetical protein